MLHALILHDPFLENEAPLGNTNQHGLQLQKNLEPCCTKYYQRLLTLAYLLMQDQPCPFDCKYLLEH